MNQVPRKTLLLLLVFIVIVAIIGFVVWKGFFATGSEDLDLSGGRMMEVSLDLSLLESERVEKLQLFKEIPELEGEHKRSNPYSAYQTTDSE